MKVTFFLVSIIISANQAWGHGEDKPGPNGGFIRMPGAFHTEIIPIEANQLKVFLLDINWKNPSVANSSLSVSYRNKKTSKAKCIAQNEYYLCEFSTSVNLNQKGQLLIEAQRENQKGNEVSYDLPLQYKPVDDGHGGH